MALHRAYTTNIAPACNIGHMKLCPQVIDYSGERTLDALIEYMEGQVSGETGDDTDTDTDSDDEGKEAEPEEVPLDKDEL